MAPLSPHLIHQNVISRFKPPLALPCYLSYINIIAGQGGMLEGLTFQFSLSCPVVSLHTMHMHMVEEMLFPVELCLAHATPERTLVRVNCHVLNQMLTSLECLGAYTASKWSLPRVCLHMRS